MLSFRDFYENITIPVYEKENYIGTLKFELIDEDIFEEAEYRGRKVKLNKPMRGGPKKFYVYVKNPKTGNIIKVNFGDPNMKIKKSNPARRRSFRARHKCDQKKDKTTSGYWSCKMWAWFISLIPIFGLL